jgi:hypothetical protein
LAKASARRVAGLFLLAAVTLLVAPVLVSEYDYRFVIPAFGPLAAAAAIGAYVLAPRLGRVRLLGPWLGRVRLLAPRLRRIRRR